MADMQERVFRVEVEPDRSQVFVRPFGELDVASVDEVDATIRQLHTTGFRHVVLDLRNLEFMDSTGIRLVLQWDAQARRDGLTFQVVPGSPGVMRPLEIAGVLDRLVLRDHAA